MIWALGCVSGFSGFASFSDGRVHFTTYVKPVYPCCLILLKSWLFCCFEIFLALTDSREQDQSWSVRTTSCLTVQRVSFKRRNARIKSPLTQHVWFKLKHIDQIVRVLRFLCVLLKKLLKALTQKKFVYRCDCRMKFSDFYGKEKCKFLSSLPSLFLCSGKLKKHFKLRKNRWIINNSPLKQFDNLKKFQQIVLLCTRDQQSLLFQNSWSI